MKFMYVVLPALCAVLSIGCQKKVSLKNVVFSGAGIAVRAEVSPAKDDVQALVGRVTVHNPSSGFVRYGNMHLYLAAPDSRAVTRIRTAKTDAVGGAVQVDPMADTKMIDLAPGDSLSFAAYWKFTTAVDFSKTEFGFEYTGEEVAPAVADTVNAGDTAALKPAKPE